MTNGASHHAAGGLDFGDSQLTARIQKGLAEVEDLMVAELSSGEPFIAEKVTHLLNAGGKRFRPMIALLASEFGETPAADNVIRSAAIVEMVHLATLYHDDVMDEADTRRGVPSANARWDNTVAILSGDYLLATMSRLLSETDLETVRHFSDTFGELVVGQMRETIGAGEANAVEHYLTVIEEKTGVLIASAAYLGARHAGAPAEHVEALSKAAAGIGIVFQIADDIIDIFSDADDSGKTPGTDLREGVFTLPVLYALEEESPAGDELRGLLTGPLTNDEDVSRALELIALTDGRSRATALIHTYLADVDAHLEALPDIPAREALRTISRYTVERVG
ncbi:polyprenyl synthetase family protein [Corynebacterium aquatimens]|uniref:Heptaprenyl diphosphate synthase n=1 Tax=Corynebacterium aquatimens TaxID=1190508 RepID=A0A931GU49_9CORY|nr:polyprenyl synthetase family protein [Corynebacterium aquatimens]MBG6122415.1 heptaprenyl diphosphate synthase [Corynebacterium aquatimens]WJY65045.1 Heptaprenyl diphosphate synthase component 2 [Corynebacterium aquatimens]